MAIRTFLRGLAGIARAFIFPTESDPGSKPKNLSQLSDELDQTFKRLDPTTPEGWGTLAAGGTALTGGVAIGDVGAIGDSEPAPSGLDAISEARKRVEASGDAYEGSSAQNMAGRRNGGQSGTGVDSSSEGADKTNQNPENDSINLQKYGGSGGGHHLPAKSVFDGDPEYDPNSAPAISNKELESLKLDHKDITNAQRSLYRDFSKTGRELTWDDVQRIEAQALINAGLKDPRTAAEVSAKAVSELKAKGINPAHIPWAK